MHNFGKLIFLIPNNAITISLCVKRYHTEVKKLLKIETKCSSQRPPALVSAPVLVYNNNGH